jgi:hypothetical protein
LWVAFQEAGLLAAAVETKVERVERSHRPRMDRLSTAREQVLLTPLKKLGANALAAARRVHTESANHAGDR